MPNYYTLEPDVAGGLGPHIVLDGQTRPPRVTRLEYVFDGWSGDDLLESYPCLVTTKSMAQRLMQAATTGFLLRDVEVSTSGEFQDLFPTRELPVFVWLDITGTAGADDFGLASDGRLVVSARALGILRHGQLEHCDVEESLGNG